MRIVPALLASTTLFAASQASAIEVAASIKPVHSLVSAVMEGVGTPSLIVSSTGSEHAYSLKPSEAQALDSANVVFFVGHGMETFLEKPLETLAADAKVVALEDLSGIEKLPFREGGPFEAHKHEEHEHEEHEGEDHAHAHDADEHADHAFDLHFWLDPVNAKAITDGIADALAEADPANAERYRANAEAYGQRLDELTTELTATLAPVKGKPFIVFHDAYQYFETRFGLTAAGSITVNPEVAPGAQRVGEIQAKVRELGVTCVFSEPQFEPKLVDTVIEGSGARTGVLDPLGSALADGPDLYPQLLRDLANSLKSCLSQES
ncbi:MAG TPA: zinc ABC transporter substrate-binding protein ZnuA [Rhizobiaceae bacterium]|nr:zinc ABC transporter substrate-binding protein ZnuA [Rhizobiaceae bacterium]